MQGCLVIRMSDIKRLKCPKLNIKLVNTFEKIKSGFSGYSLTYNENGGKNEKTFFRENQHLRFLDRCLVSGYNNNSPENRTVPSGKKFGLAGNSLIIAENTFNVSQDSLIVS